MTKPEKKPPGLGAFDELARRLVQVPKEELKEEERKYAAMRKRLRDKKGKRPKD